MSGPEADEAFMRAVVGLEDRGWLRCGLGLCVHPITDHEARLVALHCGLNCETGPARDRLLRRAYAPIDIWGYYRYQRSH